jgi:DNA-binding PucR family transcriptional regulator
MMAARGDTLSGPVSRLAEYDAKHRTFLVETLRAWLDAFGNVIEAAQAMWVHPNTFRYRLRRLVEIGGIDLDDADTRLSVMLQLRLLSKD